MAPLQAISSRSENGWTSERLAALARLTRTLPGLGSRDEDEGHIEAAAHRPDERERREIARVTGIYHEPCADRDEIDGHIIRAARHYF